MTTNYAQKIKNEYEKIARIPVPLSARAYADKESKTLRIISVWSNSVLQLKKSVKTQRVDIFDLDNLKQLNEPINLPLFNLE